MIQVNITGETQCIPFKQSMFPIGENYVKIDEPFAGILANCTNGDFHDNYRNLTINWIFNGDSEIVQLFLLVDAIRNLNKDLKISLDVPYFPGARQDRVCETGEGFGLRVYANLINSLNFEKVTVFDPHSDVLGALVNNVEIFDNLRLVTGVIVKQINCPPNIPVANYDSIITLISPDAGANKKIFKLAQKLPWKNIEVIRADKIRDTKNGKIIGTEIYCETDDIMGKTVFIVDDICSRGGTFIKLSEKLKEKATAKIILIVSHYEGTADTNKLKDSGIDKIYCFNHFGNVSKTSGYIEKIN